MYRVQLARKHYKAYQKVKTQFEETEQATEPDTAGVLELSGQDFKTTLIITVKGLHRSSRQHTRTDGQCKQRWKSQERTKKEIGEIKKTSVTEMQNAFDGLINRLDTAEKRI